MIMHRIPQKYATFSFMVTLANFPFSIILSLLHSFVNCKRGRSKQCHLLSNVVKFWTFNCARYSSCSMWKMKNLHLQWIFIMDVCYSIVCFYRSIYSSYSKCLPSALARFCECHALVNGQRQWRVVQCCVKVRQAMIQNIAVTSNGVSSTQIK